MSNFLAFKRPQWPVLPGRPSPDPKASMSEILKKGTAINLGLDSKGETVYLLIDYARPDRRPLTTIKVGEQFLSPQEFINETQGDNAE